MMGFFLRLRRAGARLASVGESLAVPILAAALVVACGANAISAESESEEGKTESAVELIMGEAVTMDEGRLELGFEGVPFDNRCPKDVQCIVAGSAKVSMAVRVEGEEEHRLTLELSARGPQVVEVAGYALSLMAVHPYPVSTRKIEPEDYKVELYWERKK
jgi:hypothetical protein